MTAEQAIHGMWHFLSKAAGKEARRDLLPVSNEEVVLRVAGRVGRQAVDQSLTGTLNVDADGQMNRSIAPDAAHVLALALSACPKTRRTKLLAELPEQLHGDGELPAVDDGLLADARSLLKRLRRTETQPKRGNVSVAYGLK